MQEIISENHEDLIWALRVAAEHSAKQAEDSAEHAETLGQLAAQLESGAAHPMFAPGAAGARAARAIQASHRDRAEYARALTERLEGLLEYLENL